MEKPIFPEGHPALCYEQHDKNDCIEPHIHVSLKDEVLGRPIVSAWTEAILVEVPDSNRRVTGEAVKVTPE